MNENRHIRRSIARQRPRAVLLRNLPFAFFPMALLALLALFMQSFVVQTHIHIRQSAGVSQSVSFATLAKTLVAGPAATANGNPAPAPRDKYPINEDPSNCPLCQEVAHSGQFVQSAAVLALLPFSVNVHFIVFNAVLPSFAAAGHSWQVRAPPTA